jgi:hypothetical protein
MAKKQSVSIQQNPAKRKNRLQFAGIPLRVRCKSPAHLCRQYMESPLKRTSPQALRCDRRECRSGFHVLRQDFSPPIRREIQYLSSYYSSKASRKAD